MTRAEEARNLPVLAAPPTHPRKAGQAGTEKEHGGGFGDGRAGLDKSVVKGHLCTGVAIVLEIQIDQRVLSAAIGAEIYDTFKHSTDYGRTVKAPTVASLVGEAAKYAAHFTTIEINAQLNQKGIPA